jgi:RND family efflux transporter MFP subunit
LVENVVMIGWTGGRVDTWTGRSALTLTAGLFAVTACGRQPNVATKRAAVQTAAGILVDTTTVRAPLQLPAQLYVEHDAVVVARAAGNVDSVLADLNDHVGSGAPLALLENADQQIALAQADASFENLSKVVARARLMTKAGGITVADSEQAEFQYHQADLARRKARRDIELTKVIAPFNGVVTARYARAGRFVNVGDTLFRVTETSPLMARVRVPESGASSIHIGDHATVSGADGGGATAGAVVASAAPVIDAASGTREVVLRVSDGSRLIPGASVTIRLGAERRHVVAIPRDAVAPDGFVLVMEGAGSALRPVTLGVDLGDGRVEIVNGLSPGERIARR